MKNEHAGSGCPSCAAWVAQLQAVEDALREVGAPVAIPGQEGTLLPPDRIRQMAMAYRTGSDRMADRIQQMHVESLEDMRRADAAEEELRAISAALEGSDGPDTDPATSRAGRVAALVTRLERDRNSSSVARSSLRRLQDELVAARARADFALTVIRVLAGKDDPSPA